MRQDRLRRVIVGLCVAVALLAVAMVALALCLLLNKPNVEKNPETQNDEKPLLTAADLRPDPTRRLLRYDAVLEKADGTLLNVTRGEQKGVVLLFWSSWCADCKAYLRDTWPQVRQAAEKQGAHAYLVCREGRKGENWSTALAAVEALGLGETLMDPASTLFQALGLRSVPSVVILDGDGTLLLSTDEMPDAAAMSAMLESVAPGGAAAQTLAFVRTLADEQGAVPSTYRVSRGAVERGPRVLSETQGLLMEAALLAEDQALFEQAYGYVAREMTVGGLCAWQVEAGQKAGMNATLDDLRVIGALLAAQEKWGGYEAEIARREKALRTTGLQAGYLRDFTAFDPLETTTAITLCYQAVDTFRALGVWHGDWARAAERAEALLQSGVISDEFPLYYPKYDAAEGRYTGDRLQMSEAMVTVLHAAQSGIRQEQTLNWLERQLADGPLYAAYTLDGKVAPGGNFESTAVYALAAQIGLASGREELTRLALARLATTRCYSAPMVGGCGSVKDDTHYTFDVMQQLLAQLRAAQAGL